ncbi:senescence/dehydration-associated protein At3g51250-like isoform X2 [Papaver somniferum]|uniref:senescence/dehydration-associated protein At3g51250-like isoform X2 n=1 Tax=Papaver somniferum TaxID=3469 RepID=UPI000E701304|nr:senescence/dehydration-associated protein At3g51250-like isoform X2 [Papaver somniferum]
MGTESAAGPISPNAGKQILDTVPGQVVLDSFGAFSRVMDAAEVAEKQALSASSKTATKMVSDRFGESAGEATECICHCRACC